MQGLLSNIRELYEFYIYIFQQDSTSTHRARETLELLTNSTPDFIFHPTLWPVATKHPSLKSVRGL